MWILAPCNSYYKRLLGAVLLCVSSASVYSEEIILTYYSESDYLNSPINNINPIELEYEATLLDSALIVAKAKYGSSKLNRIKFVSRARELSNIKNKRNINQLISMGFRQERVDKYDLVPIRVPIYFGAFGYKRCISKKEFLFEYRGLSSLESIRFAQGFGWSDADIFRENNLSVVIAPGGSRLLRFISDGKADLFCRNVHELFQELDSHEWGEFKVSEISIVYSQPRYFYTNKKNDRAVKLLEYGLSELLASGEMLRIWRGVFGSYFQRERQFECKYSVKLENKKVESFLISSSALPDFHKYAGQCHTDIGTSD